MVQTGGVKAEGGQQEILLPPPLKDIQFYGSLTPDTAQPYLAISGIGDCKGYWIGALPVPPEEPEESDEEDYAAAAEVHKTPQELVSARYSRIDPTTAPISPRCASKTPAPRESPRPRMFPKIYPDPPLDDSPRYPPPARRTIQEHDVWRIREERREIATEMARLWREDPEQWLLKSKILWAQRHEARRGQGRSEVPTAKSLSGRGNLRPSSDKNTRASGGKILSGLPNRPGRSAVSLKMLVESGHMQAGPDALWISYLNKTWSAELDAEGVIKFEGNEYNSPSAWAIFCKRIANPGKKADDGWKSVRYGEADGPMLDQLKQAYLSGHAVTHTPGGPSGPTRVLPPRKKRPMRDMGEGDSELGTPSAVSAGEEPSASKRRRAGEDSGADTPGTEFGAATPADSAGGDE